MLHPESRRVYKNDEKHHLKKSGGTNKIKLHPITFVLRYIYDVKYKFIKCDFYNQQTAE